jgi:hypothetical protein
VAGIKRQLQRLLPAIRVFLDVDDLENIGDLEKYVDQSAVILIFLSKGYFKSKNWCVQIRNPPNPPNPPKIRPKSARAHDMDVRRWCLHVGPACWQCTSISKAGRVLAMC